MREYNNNFDDNFDFFLGGRGLNMALNMAQIWLLTKTTETVMPLRQHFWQSGKNLT